MLRELSAGVVGGATNVKVRGTNDIFEGTEGKKNSEPPTCWKLGCSIVLHVGVTGYGYPKQITSTSV